MIYEFISKENKSFYVYLLLSSILFGCYENARSVENNISPISKSHISTEEFDFIVDLDTSTSILKANFVVVKNQRSVLNFSYEQDWKIPAYKLTFYKEVISTAHQIRNEIDLAELNLIITNYEISAKSELSSPTIKENNS